jgi:hypothetical protein
MTWMELHFGPVFFLCGLLLCVLAVLHAPRRPVLRDLVPAIALAGLAWLAMNAWRPHVGDVAYLVLATVHVGGLAIAQSRPWTRRAQVRRRA